MRIAFALASSLLTLTAFAQTPNRDSFDPKVTQLWEPKPQKIDATPVFQPAPSDAIVLFNGKDLSEWTNGQGASAAWDVKDNEMTVARGKGDIKTKRTFGDVQLHIEWRIPTQLEGEGQGRGNSGVFFQERYEVQVLDSYDNATYVNGQAGAVYKQSIPLVNASRKPGEWQAYDIIFTAPRFNENGRVVFPAYMTVIHNGVVIQNHVQVWGVTVDKGSPDYTPHGKASIKLQDHGNPVSFRNVWVREL